MKNTICKRIIIYFCLIMLIIGLTGCSSKTTENKKAVQGGYIETKVDLPEDINIKLILKMERNENGRPILYISDKDKNGVYKYDQNEDGKWEKSNIEWLSDVDTSEKNDLCLVSGENGEEYFYYSEDINGYGYMHLFKKTQDNGLEEIKLEGWELKPEDPEYEWPSDIKILKDGNILVSCYSGNTILFDKETYKKIKEYSVKEKYVKESKTIVKDDKIICFTSNGNNQEADSITYYDTNFNELEKIEFDKPQIDGPQDLYIDDDQIIMLNSDGIHITNLDNKMWETVVDADKTSLSSTSLYEYMMIKGNDKEYYVLYYTIDEGFELFKYSYDDSIANETESEISIYSLVDNSTVRDAKNLFQRKHPDIKVNYRVSITDTNGKVSASEKNDYIKTLNTEILSGNGPDIIILDDLPIDSYIEKGGLEDLSDIINPMLEKNELLPKIIENEKKDGKVYSIPTRINLPIIYGNKDVVNGASSLNDLYKYSNNNKGVKLFGRITYSDLLKQFLPLDACEFYNNRELDKEALAEFLDKIKMIGDNSNALIEYNDDDESKSISYDLASEAKIVLNESKSILGSDFEIAVANYVNGGFASYKNSYVPIGQLGINSSSKEVDLCKEFIKVMLSDEVQDNDHYDGFPINTLSLENWKESTKEHTAETEIENVDGSYSSIKISYPQKEEIKRLIDICRNSDNKAINDDVMFNIIIDKSLNFFKGNITSKECAQLIIDESKVYVKE